MTVPSKDFTFTGGVGNKIFAAQVNQNFDELYNWANGNVQADALKPGDGLFDSYKTILRGGIALGDTSGTGVNTLFGLGEGGSGWLDTVTGLQPPVGLYWDDADFAVALKTLKLRLRAQAYVNSILTGITFTCGLHSLASLGGVPDAIGFNLTDAAVADSTVAFANPATLTAAQGSSGDFTVPADGHYFFGVKTSAALAADSLIHILMQLQVRAVSV